MRSIPLLMMMIQQLFLRLLMEPKSFSSWSLFLMALH